MSTPEEMPLGDRIARGQEATRIRESEVTEIALGMAQGELIDKWLEGDGTGEEGRRAHAAVHALSEFERQLRVIETDGQVAEAELERIREEES